MEVSAKENSDKELEKALLSLYENLLKNAQQE